MATRTLADRQDAAAAFATRNPYGALFSADPGSSGGFSNELTGGSPAYARKTITWGAPDGNARVTGTATFDIPAGATPAYGSPCTAASGGRASDAQPATGGAPTASSQTTATVTFTHQEL